MVLRRKKIERPKNILGYALYRFDNIFNKELRNVINALKAKKKLNAKKAGILIKNAFFKIDGILDDISIDNFKTDYRSDKIRYIIIDLLNRFKKYFEIARDNDFDHSKIEGKGEAASLAAISEIRNSIKSKMKDIESDYI
ncbi:MAG: hypothetical protein FJW69_00190 [Actinobacteria bacterium]|nr:hypothetical protein [Actinomycetota bacterium]MBM3713135.1 hypothetical protein [Actinomycetota bacterium]